MRAFLLDSAPGQRREIRPLTALRGIAAFAVVLMHFSATAQTLTTVSIPSLVPRGQLAVDFFFVLSGFVMGYSHYDDFLRDGMGAFSGFLSKRAARLLPLHFAVLFLIGLASFAGQRLLTHVDPVWLHDPNLFVDLMLNAIMLHEVGLALNLNGPSWSIATETAAYLLFPAFLAAVFHRRAVVRWTSIAAILFVLLVLAVPQEHLSTDSVSRGHVWDFIKCFAEFAMGLFSYQALRLNKLVAIGSDSAAISIVVAIAAIMTFKLGDLFAVLLFPFLVLSFAYNAGRAARWITWVPITFMGEISYSLYLIHDPLRPFFKEAILRLHPAMLGGGTAMLMALLGSVATIPFATALFILVEKPSRAAVRQLLRADASRDGK